MSDSWMGSLADQGSYQPAPDNPWPPDPNIHTASPLVNISPQDIDRASSLGMAFSGGGLGIKAYHSSPHDFNAFDASKIGTGEGAQVYGHGLYFAENPAVSGGPGSEYYNQFLRRFPRDPAESYALDYLKSHGYDREAAANSIQKFLQGGVNESNKPLVSNLTEASRRLSSGEQVGPRTYEVDINADPAHMLDWDKPLSQQSPNVSSALNELRTQTNQWGQHPLSTADLIKPAMGRDAYQAMQQWARGDKPAVSGELNQAGIPGIRYLDEGSRAPPFSTRTLPQLDESIGVLRQDIASGLGDNQILQRKLDSLLNERAWHDKPKTSNYVIFDPKRINIMRKYGIAGAAPLGMGALAAQDSYNQGD